MRELELLLHFYGANVALPGTVTIPPGDDMAAVCVAGQQVLIGVDQMADGVHFDLASTPLEKIARKSLTRNLSDIAAMAAKPVGAVAATCLPRAFGQQRAEKLFDSMRQVAASFECPLIGGDIAIWDQPLMLTVTVLAEPAGVDPVTRRGAQLGDVICVTGRLGGSMETINACAHHLDFEPRLSIARKLACDPRTRPHCMIDLSDGLAVDLAHLCRASGLGAILWVDRLPVSNAANLAYQRDRTLPWHHALSDGEDYELCFTVKPEQAEKKVPREIDGVPITQVGRMTEAESTTLIMLRLANGVMEPVRDMGWEHKGK